LSSNKEIPTKEELQVKMFQFNKRLSSIQARQEDIAEDTRILFEELGDTLRPVIRDYYGMGEES